MKIQRTVAQIAILILTCINAYRATAQDSSHIRISLLTCTPGDELYSTFGHTAIRITDSISLNDAVFNYGTFNFDDPNFYTRFIRGKLLYFLSAENFEDFTYTYQSTGRGITEQLLNLSPPEKIAIAKALYENIKEENRYYKYDFFFDNCTTRIRDLIFKYRHNNPPLSPILPEGFTFRNAIHQYLDKNRMPWSKLGIDILLGAPTDKKMTVNTALFLPDNLMKTLDNSNESKQYVVASRKFYPFDKNIPVNTMLSPGWLFAIILTLLLFAGFTHIKWLASLAERCNALIFFLSGLLGILLIFMWAATDHSMCKNNYNLLWAIPTNSIMAFFLHKKSKWARIYFQAIAAIFCSLLLAWAWLPQQLNPELIPLILLLLYTSISQFLKK